MTVQQITAKAASLTAQLTIPQLVEAFVATNAMPMDAALATARGFLMDALEEQAPEAFAEWMDCEDASLMSDPSSFFVD